MDLSLVENIKLHASEIMRTHKQLQKMQQRHASSMRDGTFTRARNTTYSSRSSHCAHVKDSHEAELRRLCAMLLGLSEPVSSDATQEGAG